MSLRVKEFLDNCNSCGKCKKVCPFLNDNGTPDDIISNHPQDVFLCTNCGKCTLICPEGISPSDALFETKHGFIHDGNIPESIKKSLESANGFAMRGHRFPFYYYPSADTVFWPGCGLSGTSPEIVKKTAQILSKYLNKKVGIVLDCCFDPLYQMGDIDSVEKATKRIQERLKKHRVTHVITGCTNCTKVLSYYLSEIRVEHVLKALPDNVIHIPSTTFVQNPLSTSVNPPPRHLVKGKGGFEKVGNGEIFLHHPCPSFKLEGIRQRAKTYINSKGEINESISPSCCGAGGGISSLSKDVSDKFIGRIIKASKEKTIITYCMGCKSRFLKKGKKAYHMLEFLPGVRPIEKSASSLKKWTNRFLLSMRQRLMSKKLFLGLMVISMILLSTYLRKNGYISTDGILEFLQKYKVAAPLFFILIYAVGPSIFVPSLPLTLGAGFLWGPFWGVVFSITGATSGASVAFLISRYLIGDTIKTRFGYDRWKWLKEKVERHGWKAVAFARLVPIFPFPVLNYLFGVTPIPFLHYVWSTFIFMLPACIAYVAFGSSMGELIMKGSLKGLILGIVIASVALLLPFALRPLIKKISPLKK